MPLKNLSFYLLVFGVDIFVYYVCIKRDPWGRLARTQQVRLLLACWEAAAARVGSLIFMPSKQEH